MKNSLHNFNFVRVLASVIYFCECALWIMTAILYVLVTHFCGDQLDDFTRWHTYTHTRKMKRNVKKWHNISKSKIVWICLSKFLWFSMLNDDGMKTFQRTSLFIGFTKCGYVWDVQLPLHFIKMKFKSRTHCTMCVYFMALFAFLYTTCLPISANERVSDKEKTTGKTTEISYIRWGLLFYGLEVKMMFVIQAKKCTQVASTWNHAAESEVHKSFRRNKNNPP